MVEITSACGKWEQNENDQWNFVIDYEEGASCFDVEENISFKELTEIVFEDFNIDSSIKSIRLSYILPQIMQSSDDLSLPYNIRNDRQLRSYISKIRGESEKIMLCVKVIDKFNDVPVANVEINIELNIVHNEEVDVESNVNGNDQVIDKYNVLPVENAGSNSELNSNRNEEVDVESNVNDIEQDNAYRVQSAPDISPVPIISTSNSSRVTIDEMYVKRCFRNKKELMLVMRKWAIDWNFEFKTLWSDKSRVILGCVDENCSWKFRAIKLQLSEFFEVKKYVHTHSCDTTYRNPNHRQATSKVIGNIICNSYSEKKEGLKPKQIVEQVHARHGVHINYKKAWKAKEEAQTLMRGTPEDSYINIAKWLYMAKVKNPGTVAYLEMSDEGKFKYAFIAFGACVRGFRLMRRVIAVDGNFLKSKFKGTLLAATTQDGDYHLYPLAFCIVDSENDDSWNWFFRCLKSVIPDASDLVVVSDRAPSIAKALFEMYPAAYHCICRFHLQNNIKTRFKSEGLLPLVQAASDAYTIEEFTEVFHAILSTNPKLAEYLEEADFRKWTRAYAPANRYNMMTTNIAESLNSMLNSPRELPIRSLLETIRLTLTTWFHERRVKAGKHKNSVTKNVVKNLVAQYTEALKLDVYQVNENVFEVKRGLNKFVVNLDKKDCTCRMFNIDRIPCLHAIAAIKKSHMDVNDYVDEFHSTKTWAEAYAESIHPVGDEKTWNLPDCVGQIVCVPPSTRINRGRPAKKRKRFAGEFGVPGSKSQIHKCSRCFQVGHNKKTCDAPI